MAVTHLYTFIQNGEARVGAFAHGPYPQDDGTTLLVKELVGLRDRFIDLGVDERPHVNTVVRLMRVRGVAARFDQYGSLSTEPFEIEDAIVADALLTVEAGVVRPLGADEVARLTESAGTAQVRAYERASEWSTDYRIAYGADLYASLILTITAAAGLDMTDEVRDALSRDGRPRGARPAGGHRAPLVLAHIGSDAPDVYSPLLPEPAGGAMTPEHLDEIILLFGENLKNEMRAERREALTSVLFDLPRRSLLGWFALYEHQAGFLRELTAQVTPEEIGRRMKVPGTRPYHLQLFIVMCSHFLARQQRMLELGLAEGDPFPEERHDDLVTVVDFWERASSAYRSDGLLLPIQAGDTQRVLDDEHLGLVRELLRPPTPDTYAAVRRMAATLELYNFVLHGEQRDGIFSHGPYPGDGDRTIFVREFNDLRNDYMPWARTETRNPFPNVIVVHECHDISLRCDMFGGVVTTPMEIADRLDRLAVLTQDGGTLRALTGDEITAVQEAAAAAQIELYMKAVEWSPRYKIEYGAFLFANHLLPFFQVAGLGGGDIGERIAAACQETADRMLDDLVASVETGLPGAIWGHIGSTPGRLFWPPA